MTKQNTRNPTLRKRRKPPAPRTMLFRCQAEVTQGMPCTNQATALHPITGKPVCFTHWPPYAQQFG